MTPEEEQALRDFTAAAKKLNKVANAVREQQAMTQREIDLTQQLQAAREEIAQLRTSLNSSAAQIYHLQEDNSRYLTRINELQEETDLLRENQMPLAKKVHVLQEHYRYIQETIAVKDEIIAHMRTGKTYEECIANLRHQTNASHQEGPAQ